MDNNTNLKAAVASLESKVDMLEAELIYLNDLLMRCGFPEGIKTLKMTVEELLTEDAEASQERPSSSDRF